MGGCWRGEESPVSGEITIINQDRRAGGQTNRITQLTSPRVERTQEAAVTVPGVVSWCRLTHMFHSTVLFYSDGRISGLVIAGFQSSHGEIGFQ